MHVAGILLALLAVLVADCAVVKRQSSRTAWPPLGIPGIDYPTYSAVPPNLSFDCRDKIPGYYADPETQCQTWHWCLPSGQQHSFLCPNGTTFNQNIRVCDWWYNVRCAESANYYSINADLYKDGLGNQIKSN